MSGLLGFMLVVGLYQQSISLSFVVSSVSLLLFYFAVRRTKWDWKILSEGLSSVGIIESVYAIGQYVHWFANTKMYAVPCGSFNNPAGLAITLVAVLPFAFGLFCKRSWLWRIFGGITLLLLCSVIILSQSRAGMVAAFAIVLVFVIRRFSFLRMRYWPKWLRITIVIASCSALIGGLYFLKKDSADGRLLIWQCSARMIVDKPMLGHGAGGFQREYMLYQADYFRYHPDSRFVMRADIVKHPFNEYLLFLSERGLLGTVLLGLFAFLLIQLYRKARTKEKFNPLLCLIGIGIFACFSYPFDYAFPKLIGVFAAASLMQKEKSIVHFSGKVWAISKPAILVFLLLLISISGKMLYDEYQWNGIAQRSLRGETRKVLPEYDKLLQSTLQWKGLFLYNYAAELNYIHEWRKSNEVMQKCLRYYNDNDVQLILADNCTNLKQYKEAEKYLKLAYQMIPNRFVPLYRLVQLYQSENRIEDAKELAAEILQKPIKIPSPQVRLIKQEMNKFVEMSK